jgi:hypothetical protein
MEQQEGVVKIGRNYAKLMKKNVFIWSCTRGIFMVL